MFFLCVFLLSAKTYLQKHFLLQKCPSVTKQNVFFPSSFYFSIFSTAGLHEIPFRSGC